MLEVHDSDGAEEGWELARASALVRVGQVLRAHTRPRVGGDLHEDGGGGRSGDPRRGRVHHDWREGMTRLFLAALLAAAMTGGCRSRTDVPGDAYPQHERWWR